eukprot:15455135-Alexandrium_andersonii.AAC.1
MCCQHGGRGAFGKLWAGACKKTHPGVPGKLGAQHHLLSTQNAKEGSDFHLRGAWAKHAERSCDNVQTLPTRSPSRWQLVTPTALATSKTLLMPNFLTCS